MLCLIIVHKLWKAQTHMSEIQLETKKSRRLPLEIIKWQEKEGISATLTTIPHMN